MKKNKAKKINLKGKFINWVLMRSIDLFMWGMWLEKRKYPLYWTGQNFKHYKFSAWSATLGNLLRLKMKMNIAGACSIYLNANGVVGTAQHDLKMDQKENALFYKRLCLSGAKIYTKLARLYGEKNPLLNKAISKYNTAGIAGEDIKTNDIVEGRIDKAGRTRLYKIKMEDNNADTDTNKR